MTWAGDEEQAFAGDLLFVLGFVFVGALIGFFIGKAVCSDRDYVGAREEVTRVEARSDSIRWQLDLLFVELNELKAELDAD